MSRVVLALALFASAKAAKHYTANVADQKYAFAAFKRDHNAKYATAEEEEKRFGIFVDNLKVMDARNEADPKATHGITRFADLTQAEFSARYTNAQPPKEARPATVSIPPLAADATVNVNWAGTLTTPVKNQGYCGSCWAFSATEQIESDFWKASGTEVILAPQQITSCDKTAYGCGGGWTEHAYEYVIRAGGVETEADYPYVSGTTEVTEACVSNSTEYVVTIGGYETVSSSAAGESAMANYVASTGPLSVCLDAQSWNFYTGGILTKCGTTVDHCVQAVGLDTTGDTPYWIVRNSWGTNWGYEGYIYMEYGVNLCEIASDATYVTGAVAV